MDGRQFLDVEPNSGREILGYGPICCKAHGDKLTHVTHLVDSEYGLVGNFEPPHAGHRADRLDCTQIGGGKNRTRMPRRDDHLPNPSVCDRTADKGHVTQTGEAQVGDELTAPAHQSLVLLAEHARANSLSCHSGCSSQANA
jgi:hypothetical protein